jgi:uncharacterized membrane protein YdbT with pleckstrin-like domain
MEQQTFRPSTKLTFAVYIAVLLTVIAAAALYFAFFGGDAAWLVLVPLLLVIIPVRMHLRRLAVKLTLDSDHLVYETGLFSKTTRTLNIGKVQDVTVQQSVAQRMLGVGNVRVETAGEGSALTAVNFDNPKQIAAIILKNAHKQSELHGQGF